MPIEEIAEITDLKIDEIKKLGSCDSANIKMQKKANIKMSKNLQNYISTFKMVIYNS